MILGREKRINYFSVTNDFIKEIRYKHCIYRIREVIQHVVLEGAVQLGKTSCDYFERQKLILKLYLTTNWCK